MKQWAWLALIVSITAQSQTGDWVKFKPCGFAAPNLEKGVGETMILAPNIPWIYIHERAVMGIYANRRSRTDEPVCTFLLLNNGRMQAVLGDYEEVLNRIRGH